MSARVRIWVDGQCFQSASRYRGIGRAVLETLSFLKADHPRIDLHLSLNAAMHEEARTARAVLGPLLGQDRIHIWESLVDVPESQGGYGDLQRASEAVLTHHIRTIDPDVIWSPSVFEGAHQRFVSLLDPRPLGVPSLVTFHDAIPYRFPDRYLAPPAARAAYLRHLEGVGRYTLGLAVSEFAASELRDIHPDMPVLTVSSGLSRGFQDLDAAKISAAISPRADGPPHILYVGGLDWRKNVDRLVEALGLLDGRGFTDLRLRLVGDQPEPDVKRLMSIAERAGVAGRLDFDGFTTDAELIAAYQRCDVAVQPSIMEGFGLTALEAMRAGAPLVAARAGALPEVVGEGGLLFEPTDTEGLADAVQAVLEDDGLAARLRAAGRARCDAFDWQRTAGRVADAMMGLARPGARGAPDIKAVRARTLRDLPRLDHKAVHPERLATHIAAAERRDPVPGGRIFLDVTSTYYANHGTGIQRVVTRIAREALAQFPQAQLVICDSDIGMEAATLDARGRLRTTRRFTRERIFPRAGDTVVLLDSSWTWHRSLELVMRDARLRGAQVVSVMYDLVPVATPAFCDDGMPPVFERWLRAALRYSDAFMCISQATAEHLRDLLAALDFPRAMPIGHWPLGADATRDTSPGAGAHDQTHFLSVATLEPRKGHADLLDAFGTLWSQGEDVSLTLVGRPGWGTKGLQERVRALQEREPRFRWLSDADDNELADAYGRAGTLVATSHAEGFGLPLIEAARHGCAVIARDIPVFREVAPPGALFFTDHASLVQEVRRVALDGLPQIGQPQAMLSWADSARLLLGRILDGEYSTPFVPRLDPGFTPDRDTGVERMRGALDIDAAAVDLRILPDRVDSPYPGQRRVVVELHNRGDVPVFSRGRLLGEHAVHLSWLSYDHHGTLRDVDANRAAIPFGLGPGQRTVMAIDLPADMLDNPSIRVELALVQEGVGWWPARVALGASDGVSAEAAE